MNSICSDFENFCELVTGKVNILSIAKAKLARLLTNYQFFTSGFHKPLKTNVTSRKGGPLV